jgi:hypothetical protein
MCAAVGLGRESIDPTVQFFPITFRNDLGTAATLKTCSDDDCQEFRDEFHLEPDAEVRDNISDRGVYTTWFVQGEAPTGMCLALKFDGTYDDVVVYLSQAKPLPCPDHPLEADDVEHGDWQGHQ